MKRFIILFLYFSTTVAYAAPSKLESFKFIRDKIDQHGFTSIQFNMGLSRTIKSKLESRRSDLCLARLHTYWEEQYPSESKTYSRYEDDFSFSDMSKSGKVIIEDIHTKLENSETDVYFLKFTSTSEPFGTQYTFLVTKPGFYGGEAHKTYPSKSLKIYFNSFEITQRVKKAIQHLGILCEEPF